MMTIADFARMLKTILDGSTLAAIKMDLSNRLANAEDPPPPIVADFLNALIDEP